MKALDTESILDEARQALAQGCEIQQDDPLIAQVVLNQVILNRSIAEVSQVLEANHKQLIKNLEIEEESARQVAAKVIKESAKYLSATIEEASQQLPREVIKTIAKAAAAHEKESLDLTSWSIVAAIFATGIVMGVLGVLALWR